MQKVNLHSHFGTQIDFSLFLFPNNRSALPIASETLLTTAEFFYSPAASEYSLKIRLLRLTKRIFGIKKNTMFAKPEVSVKISARKKFHIFEEGCLNSDNPIAETFAYSKSRQRCNQNANINRSSSLVALFHSPPCSSNFF
jgi:hypothetical protein